jgi:hypothetical protein
MTEMTMKTFAAALLALSVLAAVPASAKDLTGDFSQDVWVEIERNLP